MHALYYNPKPCNRMSLGYDIIRLVHSIIRLGCTRTQQRDVCVALCSSVSRNIAVRYSANIY